MSAEQLKAAVKEYARENFPGAWDVASVVISRGDGMEPEMLVVTPGRAVPPATSPDPAPLALA
jgi:hypothetical protein